MNDFKFYILNCIEQPCRKLITQKINEQYFYLNDELRKDYKGMHAHYPTSLWAFGFHIEEYSNEIRFKKVRPSIATYEDGNSREWQDIDEFSLSPIKKEFIEAYEHGFTSVQGYKRWKERIKNPHALAKYYQQNVR